MINDLKEIQKALEVIASKEHLSWVEISELPHSFEIAKQVLAKLNPIIERLERIQPTPPIKEIDLTY